jgi:hypothetical protein
MVSRYHLYQWILWVCIFILSSTLSCSNSSDSVSTQGELFIKLLDAPASYQQLNISIELVWIHRVGVPSNIWSAASTKSVNVDLLGLRNGISEPLVLNTVPAGQYDQIKLRFGPCTVMENGSTSSLKFYNAPQFEQVLDYNFDVPEGEQAQLTFDFNVSQSVIKNGVNDYTFKPVVRIQNSLLSGSISGSVVDTNNTVVQATISTWTGLDSVSTSNNLTNGFFQLSDIPENLYSVRIVPFDTSLFYAKRIDSIEVKRQTIKNLGAIILQRH